MIKKLTGLFIVLALVAFAAVGAQANNAAVVVKDNGCTLVDAAGNLFFAPDGDQRVATNSKNGNSKITCHAQQPETTDNPTQAVHWNYENTGLSCNTGFGSTNDWDGVVTPSGKVMLNCNVNGNN